MTVGHQLFIVYRQLDVAYEASQHHGFIELKGPYRGLPQYKLHTIHAMNWINARHNEDLC